MFRKAARDSSQAVADPLTWRPQDFGHRGAKSIDNPIIEPHWSGVHVIVHVSGGKPSIRDEEAIECTAEFAEVAQAIAGAVRSNELILDGYLTVEPTQESVGVAIAVVEPPSRARTMSQFVVGERLAGPPKHKRELDPERPIAFVAVDLLAIDGELLLDVPLLERKRLLDSVLEVGDLVRITPFIRPPIDTFLTSWRSLGFARLAFKAANSRYVPSARNDDWATVAIPRR